MGDRGEVDEPGGGVPRLAKANESNAPRWQSLTGVDLPCLPHLHCMPIKLGDLNGG